MTIGKKLITSCAVLGALVVSLAALALLVVSQLGEQLAESNTRAAKRLVLVGDVQGLSGKMRGAVRGILLYSRNGRADMVARSANEFRAFSDATSKAAAELETLEDSDEGRGATRQQREAVTAWQPIVAELQRLCDAKVSDEELKAPTTQSIKAADQLDAATETLKKLEQQASEVMRARSEAIQARAHWMTSVAGLLAILVIGFVVYLVLNVVKELRQMTAELAQGAQQINSAALQVAGSSQSLAQGAAEQASALEETSASAEEITSITRQNAKAAQDASHLMVEARGIGEEVARAVTSMEESIATINRSTAEVAKIIKAVDEIAFQTNILALNAAVEAARAGEAGVGFAVVADEVRNLAQRSTSAAKSTTDLISNCVASAADGKQRLDALTGTFRRSSEIQNSVAQRAGEIAASSDEQARGVTEIGRALQQMNTVTQSTAAQSEESAAASQQMSGQVQAFNAIVGRLHQMVG